MGMIDTRRNWIATEGSPEEREAIAQRLNAPAGALAALNAVVITGAQMRAAIEAIQHIQVRSEADAMAHGLILAAFAAEHGIMPEDLASRALHARAMAMDRWCQLHDPYGQSDVDAFFEASARSPLVETDNGIGFDPQAFGELVAFIAELPF